MGKSCNFPICCNGHLASACDTTLVHFIALGTFLPAFLSLCLPLYSQITNLCLGCGLFLAEGRKTTGILIGFYIPIFRLLNCCYSSFLLLFVETMLSKYCLPKFTEFEPSMAL